MEKLTYWQPKTDKYGDRDGKTGLQPVVRRTSSFLQRWMFMGFSSSSSKALHRVRSLSSSRWMWYTSRLQQSHNRPSTAPTRLIIMGFWTLYYVTHTDQIHLVNSTTDPLSFYSFALFSFFELRFVLWGRGSWWSCSLLFIAYYTHRKVLPSDSSWIISAGNPLLCPFSRQCFWVVFNASGLPWKARTSLLLHPTHRNSASWLIWHPRCWTPFFKWLSYSVISIQCTHKPTHVRHFTQNLIR